MSVRRSVNVPQQLRVDTGDLRSIESAVRNDFDELLKSLVTGQGPDQGQVLRGFTISIAGAIGNSATALSLVVADGAVLHGTSATSGTFYLVPPTQPVETLNSLVNPRVSGSFTPNVINYISLDYTRSPDLNTSAPRALWDVVNKVEFSKILPLAETMQYKIVISSGAFAPDTLPLAIVQTDAANTVVSITDRRPMLFRLGKAGLNAPNTTYSYPWADGRSENPSTSTSIQDPFYGGDKQIKSLKEWMDAVMTEIKLMKGSSYWYTNGSSLVPNVNLSDMYADALASVMTGSGAFLHDGNTPGLLTWTSNLHIKNIMSNLSFDIPAGSVNLSNEQVAYVSLVRNQIFQPINSFTFTNGSPIVQGTITVTGVVPGEWVKLEQDSVSKWSKVQSVIGNQIILESSYEGSSFSGNAVKSTNTYTVAVADRDQVPNNANTYWIAYRSDSTVPAAIIDTIANSGLTRANNVATVKTTMPHGRAIGESIEISGASDASFDGVYEILSIVSPTEFTVTNNGSDVGPATAGDGNVNSSATIHIRGIGVVEQGESAEIGDNTVLNMLSYIGSPSESHSNPVYAAPMRNITQGESLTAAISSLDRELDKFFGQLQIKPTAPVSTRVKITGADYSMLDGRGYSQEISNLLMDFDGAEIDFATGTVYKSDGITPLGIDFTVSIPSGEYRWFSVSLVPSMLNLSKRLEVKALVIPAAATNIDKNLAERAPFGGSKKIGQIAVLGTGLSVAAITAQDIVQLGVGSGSGGDGFIPVDLHDVYSTTLPSGPSAIIDGIPVVEGTRVLFTKLASNNNQIYVANNVGVSIVWTAQNVFELGSTSPQNGAMVKVLLGSAYNNQIGTFDQTYWSFGDLTRQFNEFGDYYEVSSPRTMDLTPSTTEDVFVVAATSSENFIVDFSVKRGTIKEVGQVYITHNGVSASASTASTYTAISGVTFTADIDSGNVRLRSTTTAGTAPRLTWSVKRWSDASGGPASTIPSYSISAGVVAQGASQTAFVMSDNSGTPILCDPAAVVLGKTRITLDFPYVPGLLPGTTFGDLEVYVDGMFIPRYVAGSTLDANYTEIDQNTIEFNTDLSSFPLSIEIRKRLYVGDTTPIINKLVAMYDAVVGSPSQVLTGAATHSSITSAIAAIPSGGNILLLKNTYTEAVNINKQITIDGQGSSTVITGNVTFNASACSLERVRVNGDVTFSLGADHNYFIRSWQPNTFVIVDNGADNQFDVREI